MRAPALLFLAATLLALPAPGAEKPKKAQRVGAVHSAAEAKAIAEQETGGIATSARRTALNGATCGWEVDVHMPNEAKGWRCIIDCDTRSVHTKDRIPNPARGKRK